MCIRDSSIDSNVCNIITTAKALHKVEIKPDQPEPTNGVPAKYPTNQPTSRSAAFLQPLSEFTASMKNKDPILAPKAASGSITAAIAPTSTTHKSFIF